MGSVNIRVATVADAPAIQAIYAPMVEHTATSFEEVAPTVDQMAQRIDTTLAVYPYLVAECEGQVLGYAFASQHRARVAYRWSADVSLYIAPSAQRSGVGRRLYAELLQILQAQCFHAAYATIAMPNAGSVALHQALGFVLIGSSPEVGFKLGQWRDVTYWRKALSTATPPKQIIPFAQWREHAPGAARFTAATENATTMHPAAEQGFSSEASTYTTGRPGYPDALRTWLVEALGVTAATAVVDLGAGTGKLTRLIDPAARIIAIEPVEAMRAQFAEHLPEVSISDGMAEALPLPSAYADAVVCAQAFHWFANDMALREIHRVLRPGGRLGLVWNVRDESVEWVAEITQIITPYEGDAPRFHTGQWRQPFSNGLFSEPELSCFEYTHVGSPQAVIVDRFLSVSFIAALPAEEKCIVAERLKELISDHPALRGRSVVAFPYQTQAYLFRRR